METRTVEVFVVETCDAGKLDTYEAISDMKESGKPVVWINHGLYSLIPKLLIEGFIRATDQWVIANSRVAVYPNNFAIYWDDCELLAPYPVMVLLGEDSPECSYDTGSDDTQP